MTGWHWLTLAGVGLVLVPWVVYPVAMGWLADRIGTHPGPTAANSGTSTLSVVIATRESPEAVRTRLEDLVHGHWPADRLEVIVAVDGDPGSHDFPGLHPAPRRLVVVAREGGPGKAAALNAGMAVATSDLVVLADTAQRFAPDAMDQLVAAMADPRFGAVSGALALGNELEAHSPIAAYWRMERRLRAAEARIHSAIGVTGSIYIIRRALWRPVPDDLILDDLWIPMRLVLSGHRVGFAAGAVATDTRTTTVGQEFRRKVRTLTGNLQLVAWLPATLLPWRNPVWIQFYCHKLLRLLTPLALLVTGLGLVGSAFAVSLTVGWSVLGLGAAGAAVGAALPGSAGRRVRNTVAWGITMQGAIVVAAWNGMRGRWNVWQR